MSLPDSSFYFDLDAFWATLRRNGKRLAALAVAAGLLAAGAYGILGKQRAEGVYTLGSLQVDEKKLPPPKAGENRVPPLQYVRGIDPQHFKTIAPRFDAMGLAAFAERLPDVDPRVVERLTRTLEIDNRRRDLFSPVYGTTRGDLRELGESFRPQENAVVAMQIVHAARDRNRALEVVRLAGRFVGDTVFRAEVRDIMQLRAREAEANRLLAENVLINARFEMGLLESKGQSLGKLREAFPELMLGQPQQVISVAEGGQRFLSPAAQVVGVESMLADHRERIGNAQRQMRKGEKQESFFRNALALTDEPVTSAALLENLLKVVAASFPAGDDPDGVTAEARNEALLDLGAITALRTRGLQFVGEPAIVEREPAEIAIIGVLAGLATLVAGVLLLLARQWSKPGPRSADA